MDSIPQIAEVCGVVTSVNFPKNSQTATTFRIRCPNINRIFDVTCELYCPVRQGDTIYALCRVVNDHLFIMKPPFVQPPMDRDSVLQCFMRALKQGYGPTIKFYNVIAKIAGGDDQVIAYLSSSAQNWNDTHDSGILFMFGGIDPDTVKKLLNWWHKERNLRRLYLFGLTKKEINAARMTCEDIYQKCMVNPYTIPAIPLEKGDNILASINKKVDPKERERGTIIRTLWKYLHESAWVGMPNRLLVKQFPKIKEHVEILRNNYGMKTELETCYLEFPHKVETFLSDFVFTKVSRDPIRYDTPLDQVESNNKRESAHFTRELSMDQQKAVQGALDHSLSIITGGAGCGKCLGQGTKVLMFDGSIKLVENIIKGDQLMGPDSLPRNVLSTTKGVGKLFEIIPKKRDRFICNKAHILTLRGIVPYITEQKGIYTLFYSIRGKFYSQEFKDSETANLAIKELPIDVFDISLKRYLRSSPEFRKNTFLFHNRIIFPKLDDGHIATGNFVTTLLNYLSGTLLFGDELALLLNENNEPHIPQAYKVGSLTDRSMISDAIIFISKQVPKFRREIILSDKLLAEDIRFLFLSLGKMVSVEQIDQEQYKIIIHTFSNSFDDDSDQSDSEEYQEYLKQLMTENLSRFKVKKLEKGDYYGFTLDSDGRFLLGDFTVTHNTTCIGEIVHNLELRGTPYAICSFTGKAVARLREVIKRKNPSTIHRLIYNSRKNRLDKRSDEFEKELPLHDYEHIIIDEASMVTTELFYDLSHAYPDVKKYTFVGDCNQLSPISWGNLLLNMLKSQTIPTYRLTNNYRVYTATGERDGVILNANAIINHDATFPFEFVTTSNFSIYEGPIERVFDIIKACYQNNIKASSLVIITPYNRYLEVLNKTFQTIYNDGSRSVTDLRGIKWMIGDRVMLTENDADIGVYNGESGNITDITDKAIMVDFGQSGCHEFLLEPTRDPKLYLDQGTSIGYKKFNRAKSDDVMDDYEGENDEERTVKKLIHAYAMTVDKSQGSEWDFVIVYIPEFNTGSFLNKNRIYTAITRTKRCCWCIVTDAEAFNNVSVKTQPYRCENLAKRLTGRLPNMPAYQLKIEAKPEVKDVSMANDLPADKIPMELMDTGVDCDDFC